MTSNPKLTAQQARERANKGAEYVRDLRRLLGQAMTEAEWANAEAREAERAAR